MTLETNILPLSLLKLAEQKHITGVSNDWVAPTSRVTAPNTRKMPV
jgi:hypothetical protein